jgi:hypothetical protein
MSTKTAILASVPLCALLLACSGPAPQEDASGDQAPTPAEPAAFAVDVTLSDAARQQFAHSDETVIVSARYYGEPAEGIPANAVNEVGQVDLGHTEVELHGGGRARFDGSAILPSRRTWISGGPQVEVSVFSGRNSSPDNLLDCDPYQGPLPGEPLAINCRLIGGEESAAAQ